MHEFSGDPITTTVLLRAKDGGTMHRLRYLDEAVRLYSHIRENVTARYLNEKTHQTEEVRFADMCGPFCEANVAVELFSVS